uniref:Uncharacterized protein n=1 Tax=Arundo donax TaxID=35708 RepID=A0A0A9FTV7_ARUDO
MSIFAFLSSTVAPGFITSTAPKKKVCCTVMSHLWALLGLGEENRDTDKSCSVANNI